MPYNYKIYIHDTPIPCKRHVFLCSKTCVCVGDMHYTPVASTIAILLLAEESIDPESIAITLLRKQQFMWHLHKWVEWLLDSACTKILFKYMVESSYSTLISMHLWQFSIHLCRKLIYVLP